MKMQSFKVDLEYRDLGVSRVKEAVVSVPLPGLTCRNLMDAMEGVAMKAKAEWAKELMADASFDANGRSEAMVAKNILVAGLCRAAAISERFNFLATYPSLGEGNFNDLVEAADSEEAEFQGRWSMAENMGIDPNQDGFEAFFHAMDKVRNVSLMAEPVSRDEMVTMIEKLHAAAVAVGADVQVTDQSADLLRLLGKEPAPAPGTSP